MRNAYAHGDAGILLFVAAGIALLSVAGLARQAWTALEHQRATEARLRDNVATIAARGVTSRVQSIVANRAQTLVELVQSRHEAELTKRAQMITDSLASCGCDERFHVSRIVIRKLDGLVGEPRPREIPIVYFRHPASVGALVRVTNDVVADVEFAPNVLTRDLLPFVLDSIGTIVPTVLTGRDDNRSAFAISVTDGANTVFHSEPLYVAAHARATPLFERGRVKLTAIANPFLAVAAPPIGWPGSGVTAVATVLAVLASTALAVRSAQLGAARSAFTAAVSHELRTPLTEIILYAEMVESGRTGSEADVVQAAALIRGEAQRLHQMVENVLHVSRRTRDRFTVAPEQRRLASFLQATVNGFAAIAGQHGSQIRLDVVDDPEVLVDAGAVRQVILNLLDNAVRYGPDGQTIVVRLTGSGDGGTIEVDDEGPGIPADDRDRLFRPYTRLARDLDRARSGTGLGLSVVRTLVTEMGGDVRLAESTRGGLLVRVSLPGPTTIAA